MPGRRPQRRGFSLVEMMVVIGIVGIIATISAPPIFRYVQSNRLQTNTDRLAADLQYARSLSIASSQILRFTATPLGYELTNPNTGEVTARTPLASADELRAAVAVAAEAFPAWAATNPQRRARVMFEFKRLLEANMNELAMML